MIVKTNRGTSANSKKRVAVYCRVSTEEQTRREYSSLDAQRDSCDNFIKAHANEGWRAIEKTYCDPGFSGSNMKRPDLQRLLADARQGLIDIVCVYKLDRISRRQFDLLTIVQTLDENRVGFVCITQPFDTNNPMGRFMLQTLGAFAELERETIRERTRDKIQASRARGQFTGGRPLLGFDIINSKLVLNPEEAERVREIFQLYLQLGSILRVVKELNHRGWHGKSFTSLQGKRYEGGQFTKTNLAQFLRNPLYAGYQRAGELLVPGQQERIVDLKTWEAVGTRLSAQAKIPGIESDFKRIVLLRGLVKCGRCGSSWTHNQTSKKGGRVYAYYECQKIQKLGAAACRGSRCNAEKLEEAIVSEVMAQFSAGKLRLREAVLEDSTQPLSEIWPTLFIGERARILQLIIERIVVNAETAEFQITFRDLDARDSRKNEPVECHS